jgi:hypothetical protein
MPCACWPAGPPPATTSSRRHRPTTPTSLSRSRRPTDQANLDQPQPGTLPRPCSEQRSPNERTNTGRLHSSAPPACPTTPTPSVVTSNPDRELEASPQGALTDRDCGLRQAASSQVRSPPSYSANQPPDHRGEKPRLAAPTGPRSRPTKLRRHRRAAAQAAGVHTAAHPEDRGGRPASGSGRPVSLCERAGQDTPGRWPAGGERGYQEEGVGRPVRQRRRRVAAGRGARAGRGAPLPRPQGRQGDPYGVWRFCLKSADRRGALTALVLPALTRFRPLGAPSPRRSLSHPAEP